MSLGERDAGGGPGRIRLHADKEAVERLLKMPPLAFLQASARTEEVEAAFFDTSRGLLRKAGFALCVERRDGGTSQTVLAADGAWDRAATRLCSGEVEDLEPNLDLLTGMPDIPAKLAGKTLEPICRFNLQKQTMILPGDGGGEIAVTIETGTRKAGGESDSVHDIVLTAGKDASQAAICRLAIALHGLEPLTLEPRSLGVAVGMLASGKPPAWTKAGAVPLDATTTLDGGIAAILGQCLDQWMDNQAAACDGRDIEGVHQMRVAMRRMRAAFAFLKPWLEGEQAAWFDGEIKRMARRLGAARDLDVLLADTLAPVARARGKDADLEALGRAIAAAQSKAHDRLTDAVAAPRYTTLVLSLSAWIAGHGWRTGDDETWEKPLGLAARPGLEAAYRQVLEAGGDFVSLDVLQRHDLRLDIKRLRYALQFVGGAFGASAAPWTRPLADLQDGLGAANDAVLAEELIGAVIAAGRHKPRQKRRLDRAGGLVVGWWLGHAGVREEALRALWRRFAALEPFWRADEVEQA